MTQFSKFFLKSNLIAATNPLMESLTSRLLSASRCQIAESLGAEARLRAVLEIRIYFLKFSSIKKRKLPNHLRTRIQHLSGSVQDGSLKSWVVFFILNKYFCRIFLISCIIYRLFFLFLALCLYSLTPKSSRCIIQGADLSRFLPDSLCPHR